MALGARDGTDDGSSKGTIVGRFDGMELGASVLGCFEGTPLGLADGSCDGREEGSVLGEGLVVGGSVGTGVVG